MEDFLDPKVLDMLAVKTDEVLKVTLLILSCSCVLQRDSNAVSYYRTVRKTLFWLGIYLLSNHTAMMIAMSFLNIVVDITTV